MYVKSYRAAKGQAVELKHKIERGSMAHTETLEKRDRHIQAAKTRLREPRGSSGCRAKMLGSARSRGKNTSR